MKPFAKFALAAFALAAAPAFAETHYIETPGPNPDYVSPEQKAQQAHDRQGGLCSQETAIFALVSGYRDGGLDSPEETYRTVVGMVHQYPQNYMSDDLVKKIVNFVYFNEKAQGVNFASSAGNSFVFSYCMRDWQPAHDWQPVK